MTLTTKGRLHLSVLPQVWAEVRDLIGSDEPSVRPRDCADGASPCPWRQCPYAVDNPTHPEVTCALDVAEEPTPDDEPMTLRYVADILGVSAPTVLKHERRALRKIAQHPAHGALLAAARDLGLTDP